MAASTRTVVSVIVPMYNKADYIGRTIESVLDQDFGDFEIIVVDDGSNDGSRDAVLRYADSLTYVSQERAGAGAARNRGMHLAKGQLLAFLDADDPWAPRKLRWQVEFMESHPDIQWCSTNYWTFAPGAAESRPGVPYEGSSDDPSWIVVDWFEAMARKDVAFQTSGVVLRKSLLERVGDFDVTIHSGQDLDYWIRIAEETPRCGYCTTPCYSFTRDSAYSITYSESRKYAAKAGMLTRHIERSRRPGKPSAYRELIRQKCEDTVRAAIAQGFPDEARTILRGYPPEWESLRHSGYMLLSYVPAPIIRFVARLAGHRVHALPDTA